MITALCVNYNTPGLLERLLTSFRRYYPDISFLVIDGSDQAYYNQIRDFPKRFNVELKHFDFNIHHGPGMAYGIRQIKTDQILLLDTDIIVLRGGWIELLQQRLLPDNYGIGDIQKESFMRGGRKEVIDYLHPACALVNRKVILQYPLPTKAGCPLMDAMVNIYQNRKDILQKSDLITNDFWNHTDIYIQHGHDHKGMGTVVKTGGYHYEPEKGKKEGAIIDTIGIVIATFQRPDGKTPYYLNRTLESIEAQTFKDYRVYVMGDAYTDDDELREITSKFSNVITHNLDKSVERERYPKGGQYLWCCGGVTAANKGIDYALADGIEYICHQGHDDTWEPNHLELINKVIREKHPFFICTSASYGLGHLPPHPLTNDVVPYLPVPAGVIASSVCIKYTETKLRVMDRFHEEGIMSPSDAYLWECMDKEMIKEDKKGFLITTLTCRHDEEGYVLNGGDFKSSAVIKKKDEKPQSVISEVTAIITTRNNLKDFKKCYKSIKKFHAEIPVIIIDQSEITDKCCDYVCSLNLNPGNVTSVLFGEYIGTGKALRAGISMVGTKYAMIVDSCMEMKKSPIPEMLKLMELNTFAIGELELHDSCGVTYGNSELSSDETPTLSFKNYPFFQLINIGNYKKFPAYVNHESPWFKAMNEIKKQGLSSKILKTFPVTRSKMNDYVE